MSLLFWAILAVLQPPPAPAAPAVEAPRPITVRVTLTTGAGPIVLELEKERAPLSTANFLRYVDGKRLDGATFYRAVKVQDGFGLIQSGVGTDYKRALPPVALEPTSRTGLRHLDGTISLARAAPNSGGPDFFITIGAQPTMDADPAAPGDNQGFAAFGRVVAGMDTVRRILDAPTSPTAGEGAMKGQMIAAPIRILSARRAD